MYREKIGALVDIYAGYYPDFFEKDEKLAREYWNKLENFCYEYHRLFPSLQYNRLSSEVKIPPKK